MTNNTTVIEHRICQQRREDLIAELSYLSDDDMREIGIWGASIESLVDELIGNMGCVA